VYDIVLECKNVNHWFGAAKILHDVNLQVARGETVALVGSTGCGKSTLLRAMLGTHPPRAGAILMNGRPVTQPGRERGIVYQRYALFPYMTALENVAFGPLIQHSSLWERLFRPWRTRSLYKQHLKAAAEQLDKVRLSHALDMYPAQMSGGMCQRVAIAQALIMKPEILLLDEPFGALDEATREEQQEFLLLLYHENLAAKGAGQKPPYTMIIVTHELNEAMYVADRVVALSRHWLWEGANIAEHPGATVVYDAASPASPRDSVDRHADFLVQRKEIRTVAFEPPTRLKPSKQYIRFWDEVRDGKGPAVMKP
jgi:NitT/TauT family transport system ATP-binding protein